MGENLFSFRVRGLRANPLDSSLGKYARRPEGSYRPRSKKSLICLKRERGTKKGFFFVLLLQRESKMTKVLL